MNKGETQNYTDNVLPMAEQMPLGFSSESDIWYQYTLRSEDVPSNKRVVVVMAHDDDILEFAGGTIRGLVEKGYSVTGVTLTDGRYGGDARNPMTHQELVNTRLEETLRAAEIVGLSRIINLGATDRSLSVDPLNNLSLLDNLIAVMRQEGGSIYITHPASWNPKTRDYHPDHRNTPHFVLEAAQMARFGNYKTEELGTPLQDTPTLLFADTQGSRNENGHTDGKSVLASDVTFLVDTSKVAEIKTHSFGQFVSQINNLPEGLPNYVMQREIVDRFRGGQARRRLFHRPTHAEGFNIHAGAGFNTDISGLFGKDLFTTKKVFVRKRVPIF